MAKAESAIFLQALGIVPGDLVCLVGAGGKTSLMTTLAREAKQRGLRVLVTTSTRMGMPSGEDFDGMDLSGRLFEEQSIDGPGMYIGGLPSACNTKMVAVEDLDQLSRRPQFDLVLVEADGSARKPLKGWKPWEPVIVKGTTKTIGLVDISTVGKVIGPRLVHRMDLFERITGGKEGEQVTTNHLRRMIEHENGLFQKAEGERILYINKVESEQALSHVQDIVTKLEVSIKVRAGSVHNATIAM